MCGTALSQQTGVPASTPRHQHHSAPVRTTTHHTLGSTPTPTRAAAAAAAAAGESMLSDWDRRKAAAAASVSEDEAVVVPVCKGMHQVWPVCSFIKDLLRSTLACKSVVDLQAAYDAIVAGFDAEEVTEVKNQLLKHVHDVVLVVRFDGMLVEIQLHLAEVLELKVLMHLPYEVTHPKRVGSRECPWHVPCRGPQSRTLVAHCLVLLIDRLIHLLGLCSINC
jgi:hypothetical protein